MTDLVIIENKKVREIEYNGEWYFSVVDVVAILTENFVAKGYWADPKRKLQEEEDFTEVHDKIVQLKLEANDGKKYITNLETMFKIMQSIPSPKAESFTALRNVENGVINAVLAIADPIKFI
jgi:hypothetical protein